MARTGAALLLLLVCACSGTGETTTKLEQPRRFADYGGTGSPAADQCGLPVAERTGGWFCPDTE